MEWISGHVKPMFDEQFAVCAFWNRILRSYSFVFGHWDAINRKFSYSAGVNPDGELLYWVPLEGPPKPYVEKKPTRAEVFQLRQSLGRCLDILRRWEE